MPQSRTERRAYDLIAEGFGPGANGPLVVAVDLAGDPTVLAPLSSAIAADPGIADVAPPVIDTQSDVAILAVEPTTTPQSEATRDTIDRLRSDVLPSVLDDSPARAHVGGQVAVFADLGHRVQDRLPLFIGAVVLLSFVLLMVMFRSLLVPLKAAVMNLLSVSAAYGVLVMVFQWGWGADLIGLESTVPILSFIPLFMFAILFGLSMDYEVFLLSRVREEYLRTGDNGEAVIRGLAGTGRTITSAALIMVVVFGGFAFGEDPLAKMMGLGLATAIADRRQHRPAGPGAGHHEADGPGELVAAGLARPVAAGWPGTAGSPTRLTAGREPHQVAVEVDVVDRALGAGRRCRRTGAGSRPSCRRRSREGRRCASAVASSVAARAIRLPRSARSPVLGRGVERGRDRDRRAGTRRAVAAARRRPSRAGRCRRSRRG